MKKLNLGCGDKVLVGYDNFDLYPYNDKVKKIDLNNLPLPFPDDYADEILLSHVFEHLSVNRLDFMREISRICKMGGKVVINVPGNKNICEHEKVFFTLSYFNKLAVDYQMFSQINSSYQFHKLKDIVWKVKEWLFYLIVKEFRYEFKK